MNAPMRSSQLRRISVVPRAMKFFLRLLESLSKGSLILSLPDGQYITMAVPNTARVQR